MTTILTFEQAIKDSERFKKRHLLLGNGFSIACRRKIFTYESLFKKANFSSDPKLQEVFDAVGTTDFERVIKMLEDASHAVPVYSTEATETSKQMLADAEKLKNILIETVAKNHPESPDKIDDEQFQACRQFLSYFLGTANEGGKVYTLNYDLLLYWALMYEDTGFGGSIRLDPNDGFGRDKYTEPKYVNWMGESTARGQCVHYLHGALHLFDAGGELQKYTWTNTGKPLLKQAQEAMQENKFPLFVAEGESIQKLTKIKHSAYLYHSYKSFSSQMEQPKDALFIFGHSLANNDQHILKKVSQGKIGQIYVGLYGPEKKKVQQRAEALVRERDDSNRGRDKGRVPLIVKFFDTNSAEVWGRNA